MGELFRDPVIRRKVAEGRLPDTWREVVGEPAASCTDSVVFKNGILTVHIASSVVRHETFMRRSVLRDAINARTGIALVREVIIR